MLLAMDGCNGTILKALTASHARPLRGTFPALRHRAVALRSSLDPFGRSTLVPAFQACALRAPKAVDFRGRKSPRSKARSPCVPVPAIRPNAGFALCDGDQLGVRCKGRFASALAPDAQPAPCIARKPSSHWNGSPPGTGVHPDPAEGRALRAVFIKSKARSPKRLAQITSKSKARCRALKLITYRQPKRVA